MTEIKSEGGGTVRIADEALAVIASAAALEVEGVSVTNSTYAQEAASKVMRKSTIKGVNVSVVDEIVNLSLALTVKMGAKLHEVAKEVQSRVKTAIETMTGLTVGEVNISIGAVTVGNGKRRT